MAGVTINATGQSFNVQGLGSGEIIAKHFVPLIRLRFVVGWVWGGVSLAENDEWVGGMWRLAVEDHGDEMAINEVLSEREGP